jgi:hypothetical protein
MGVVLLLVIIIGLPLLVLHINAKNDDKIMEEKEQIKRKMEVNKEKYYEENNIPENAYLIRCTNRIVKEMPIEGKWNVFLWKEDNIISLCGQNESDGIRKIEIPIESIKYYDRSGDYRVDTVTEGGGISWGKAIVGGIIGVLIGWFVGGLMDSYSDVSNFRIFTHSTVYSTVLTIIGLLVGLLLAGRNKTITKNKEIDNRKTYFYYSEDNKDKKMVFTSKDYESLLKLIPEKEMSYIENNKILKSDELKNDNVYRDIEKLSELKEKGILTEEEFMNKKQLLLDKIQ